jgi:hypothetical protein
MICKTLAPSLAAETRGMWPDSVVCTVHVVAHESGNNHDGIVTAAVAFGRLGTPHDYQGKNPYRKRPPDLEDFLRRAIKSYNKPSE